MRTKTACTTHFHRVGSNRELAAEQFVFDALDLRRVCDNNAINLTAVSAIRKSYSYKITIKSSSNVFVYKLRRTMSRVYTI